MDIFKDVRGKCKKKNPTTCRLHGKAATERYEFIRSMRLAERQKKEAELQNEFNQKAAADFKNSWKLREEPDGTTTVAVYRSGVPSAPAERGVEKPYYLKCDQHLPDTRQGRMTGVFCSPTLGGVARWVRGNHLTFIPDINVREIRVDIDSTYVYLVHDWERASALDLPEMYQRYWKNGMTMREYMAAAEAEPHKHDPREYELLVPEAGIRSVKDVTPAKVIKSAYDNQEDLSRIYRDVARKQQFALAFD